MDLQKEFEIFAGDLEKRLKEIGLNLLSFPLDHACYRIESREDYPKFKKLLIQESILYTEKFFHERKFHTFVLKTPLRYKDISIRYLEFAEPGGSDNYKNGFQHVEFITNKNWKDVVSPEIISKMLFISKNGEEYIKWEDKTVIKLTATPQITKALTEDNPTIFVV